MTPCRFHAAATRRGDDAFSLEPGVARVTIVTGLRATRNPSLESVAMAPIDLLRQLPLFASFGDAALARLASRCVPRSFPAGHVLFTTGEPCRGLYLVESGRVRIYRTSPGGREQVLHTEGP